MNTKVLKTLEYEKILERLAGCATSEAGKELCLQLLPSDSEKAIHRSLADTRDALERIYKNGDFSCSGLRDPKRSVGRLKIGGALSAGELLDIAQLLEISGRVRAYGEKAGGSDALSGLFRGLSPLPGIADEIKNAIISPEEISDSASRELKNIRKFIGSMDANIHAALNKVLSGPSRMYLQDAVITMRNGRYCLPVRAEHKTRVQGMIHDRSASGGTFFIEPMSVVQLNNDLREAELKEKAEIERILSELSARCAEETDAISADFRLLGRLDFIFAKARLADQMRAMEPSFNTDGWIDIRKGRHPLLDQESVVPIDVHIGKEFTSLIITGPNTGGKTVTLKTVGLLTLMGQSGLFIPAADRSSLAIFSEVYADIGDEQSIEQSLSTFSSHMTNIVSILARADLKSLVLFDELCAGTDPTEGAALAVSILEELRKRGSRILATTHYSELKVYALGNDGVENACCEFNVDTLSPTYKLLVGVPGKSNAFAISEKLGLGRMIIDDARGRLNTDERKMSDVIADLEESRAQMTHEREEAKRYKEEIESLRAESKKREKQVEEQRRRIIEDARREAEEYLQSAKDEADRSIKNFRKYGSGGGSLSDLERERENIRKALKKTRKDAPSEGPVKNNNVPKSLHIGDTVRVLSLNMKGTVHTLPDAKGNLTVQMGILSYQVNIGDLVLEEEEPKTKKTVRRAGGGYAGQKALSISPEINIIGKTVDEAIPLVEKYIDDACLANLERVRIVHGKGTGALRRAVQERLKRMSCVKEFRLGEYGEGDTGVTVVMLK